MCVMCVMCVMGSFYQKLCGRRAKVSTPYKKEDGAVYPFWCFAFVYIYPFSVSQPSNEEPRKTGC